MDIKYGLPAALIGVSITIAQPQIVRALSVKEVDKIAESVTVLVDGPSPGLFGSGVLIKRQGNTYTVVTANHVVKSEGTYSIITPDQKRYSLDYGTVKRLPGVDLAVFTFTSEQSYSIAKLGDSTSISRGMNCYVTGFPSTGNALTAPVYVFTDGKLAANANKPLADGYTLMYNNETLPGMSGGPVLNDRGELIGIHGRGVESKVEPSATNPEIGRVKTAYNLGLSINTFLSLVPKVDSALAVGTPPLQPQSLQPKADDFFLQAEEKSKNSDFQGAIRAYDQAITLNPKYAEAYAGRGSVRGDLSDFQGAMRDLDQAIVLNPQLAVAYVYRSNIRGHSSDFQGAQKDIDQAIALNPKFADAYISRSSLRANLGDFQGALKDVDQAIALNPKLVSAYINRAALRGHLGDLQGALKDADQAIALNPKSAYGYAHRSGIRVNLGDSQGALKDTDQAIALNPQLAVAYVSRSGIRGYLNDLQGALKDADQAISLNSKLVSAYAVRANIRSASKDYQGALKDADRAIALNPKLAHGYSVRGFAQGELGNAQGAIQDFSKVISLNPKYAEAYYRRGFWRAKLNDKKGALADYRKAAALAQEQKNTDLSGRVQKAIQKLGGR